MEALTDTATLEAGNSLFTIWGVRLVGALLILIAAWVIGRWLDGMVNGFKRFDKTLLNFLGGLLKYSIMIIAIVMVLGQFGIQTASLLAVLGAAGLAIGLALQGTLSNVAAGVMLLILRPFSVGDSIETETVAGTVKTLGLFGTEIATADNVYIFAPNSSIWNKEIRNYSRNRTRRQDLVFPIHAEDNIDKAVKTINAIIEGEERILHTENKEPLVFVDTIDRSQTMIVARVWSSNSDYWQLKWNLNEAIKKALDKAGINPPRAQGIELFEHKSAKKE
ncbi:MAG: mechanosensitive ion channel family protein [Alphaproteobacteria bacterium]